MKQACHNYTGADFSFVVCAYKESKYLEECIQSVMNQSLGVNVVISTSTPNSFVMGLAKKYGLEVFVNEGPQGIAEDWNFAYSCAKTSIVSIAHQDDVYGPDYAKTMLELVNGCNKPLIAFSDYGELRDGVVVTDNKLLRIKKVMLFPLRSMILQSSVCMRRRVLSLGSAICCPSVTMIKDNLPEVLFEPHFKSNVDWEAWEKLTRLKGQFVYNHSVQMYHRIHEESTTTQLINDNSRGQEDLEMFCKFWPKGMAKVINKIYSKGEESNELR